MNKSQCKKELNQTAQCKNKKIHIPKPILKWVGGKTQIIDTLITNFPVEINNYREVFFRGRQCFIKFIVLCKKRTYKNTQ